MRREDTVKTLVCHRRFFRKTVLGTCGLTGAGGSCVGFGRNFSIASRTSRSSGESG
jgi:hypothetical protein